MSNPSDAAMRAADEAIGTLDTIRLCDWNSNDYEKEMQKRRILIARKYDDAFAPAIKALQQIYALPDERATESSWIAIQTIKQLGIPLEEEFEPLGNSEELEEQD